MNRVSQVIFSCNDYATRGLLRNVLCGGIQAHFKAYSKSLKIRTIRTIIKKH